MEKVIVLKNQKTGEVKEIKIGYHWMVMLFGWLVFPLTKLGLTSHGVIFLLIVLFNIISPFILPALEQVTTTLSTAVTVTLIVYGFIVPKIATKNYLKNGWEFSDPQSEEVKKIKEKWKIS